jgi:hypothetical protein
MISGLISTSFSSRVFAHAQVDDRDALGDADLRRGQADALRGIHGLKHVGDQLAQLVVEFGDRLARLLQHRLGIFHDRENHCVLPARRSF